jgi:hypothetical protein
MVKRRYRNNGSKNLTNVKNIPVENVITPLIYAAATLVVAF